jgi:hypothetical protein
MTHRCVEWPGLPHGTHTVHPKDELWISPPWLRALQDYNVPPFGEERLKFNVRWVLCEGYWRTTPLLLVAVTQVGGVGGGWLVTTVYCLVGTSASEKSYFNRFLRLVDVSS